MMIDRSPGPLAQRLWSDMVAQLAQHAGCCPVHGTRLICAWCDIADTGAVREQLERDALVARSALYDLAWPAWPCGRCDTQDSALCLDCYEPVKDQAFAGLTPAEEARLLTLCERTVRYTFLPAPDAADTGQQPHGGEGTS
jgi:hypothetical protein